MTDTARDTLDIVLSELGYANSEGLAEQGDDSAPDGRGFVWRELSRKAGASAAYFRGGVPLVAFGVGRENAQGLHRRLWNLSRVPVLLVAGEGSVDAYSCFVAPSPPDEGNEAHLATCAPDEVGQLLRDFSRASLESGRLASTSPGKFNRDGRVDSRLLRNLRDLRASFIAKGSERAVLDQLLGRSIFIRYFEDRGILTSTQLEHLTGHESYLEVLRAGTDSTYELLAALADRFNGDVFGFDAVEPSLDLSPDLQRIADFFSGADVESGQQVFWPYDFGVIPPELISSVYEQLLEDSQQANAAFYTPRHVVDLVLDEAVPWVHQDAAYSPRVLDPACGSGIFLTEAFRRLAFRASLRPGGPLGASQLSELLKQSIFGVDLDETALSVAALGLYLALMEELDPTTAWEEAHLPPLVGSNLLAGDFFSDHGLSDERFDVIVGNPPWKSRLTSPAKEFLNTARVRVPDQQIAIAFVFRAASMLSNEGVLGLLLPSKPLLHNRSDQAQGVRRELFGSLDVQSVIDLSPLRKGVFASAIAPAAVLVARPIAEGQGSDQEILHVVPRLSPLQQAIDGFVMSSNDVHRVPAQLAQSSPELWKVLLWGSEGDLELIDRLRRRHRSLRQVALERGWLHGQGFQIKGGDKNSAEGLRGLPFVPTEAVRPFVADTSSFGRVTADTMHRPRDPRLYKAPHVLVRRGLVGGRPAAALLKIDAGHNNGVFGISAPAEDEPLLELLVGYINSALGQYFQFMTSSSWGVERDFIEVSEHLSLPFAEPSSAAAEAVRVAVRRASAGRQPMAVAEGRSAQLDEAVFDAFGLQEYERLRVLDALSIKLDQFENRTESTAFVPASREQLGAYLSTLERELTTTLDSLTVATRFSESSAAYLVATIQMSHAERPDTEVPGGGEVTARLLAAADAAAQEWPSPATVVQPSLVVLEGEEAHLVKPNERRYWSRSNALEDARVVLGAVTQLAIGEGPDT